MTKEKILAEEAQEKQVEGSSQTRESESPNAAASDHPSKPAPAPGLIL